MNSSYTPGPWTYTDEHNGSFYIRDNKMLQLIWLGNSTRFESGENKANAQLIAAAPQLLEALINLVRSEDEAEAAMRAMGIEAETEENPLLAEARAAIAKAFGEST